MDTNKLDYSTQFDAWWWSNIPEIKLSADWICGKIPEDQMEGYKLSRLKNHLKVILTNLHVAHKSNSKLYIAISLRIGSYQKSKRYPKLFLSYKYIAFLVKFLSDEGYIELHKGINFEHYKRCSRMKASPKLLRLFKRYHAEGGKIIRRTVPIILRDEQKNEVDFDINDLQIKEHLVRAI